MYAVWNALIMLHNQIVSKCINLNTMYSFIILKGSMMRFLSFLSLWTVSSWLWINKIPEVAKTKASKPKRYSLSKLRLGHAPLKRLIQTRSACLHHDVGRFAKHHPNIHAKKEGVTFVLAVVLLLPPAPCHGGALWANPNSWFELCT